VTPGQRGQAAAETILDAVKTGQLCLTFNNLESAHPGLWAEIRMALANLDPQLEAGAGRLTARLVVSSSSARLPCRFEADNTVLFHLRGFQRVWVYPGDELHLPQIEVEKTIAGQASGCLPHNRIEDNAAWRFGVVPGEAIAWPLHAPHYAENEEGLCVSVFVTYETAASRETNGVHLLNGMLRRWRLEIPRLAETSATRRRLLWLAYRVASAFGLVSTSATPPRNVVDAARAAIEQDWQIERRSLAA
jgi:hypothetical protein